MSSTIGNLVHGAPAQATDQIPIQRGTTQNFKLLVSDITALVPPTTLTWAGLTGDLTKTQVIPWDKEAGPVGTPGTGISLLADGSLAIGNGTAGDFSGSLKLTSVLITDTAANIDLTVQNTTTATSSTTNASPSLEFAANYWTGSASAADTWTIGSLLAAGTNGQSILNITQRGSSNGGAPPILQTNAVIYAPTTFPAYQYPSYAFTGQTSSGLYFDTTAHSISFSLDAFPALSILSTSANSYASFVYGWGNSGFGYSSTNDTGLSRISAGIIGAGTGGAGSIAGSIQCASIALNGAVASPTAGIYYSGTNAGITQAAEAVGTIATTGGIVTTFTAVSDERLKISQEYSGGLDEILQIQPIKYRWNKTGQKYSGQSTERDFIGFSAQNVQKSIPEAVWVSKDDYLGFEDRPVLSAAVNAIKELYAIIKEQTKRIEELEGKK